MPSHIKLVDFRDAEEKSKNWLPVKTYLSKIFKKGLMSVVCSERKCDNNLHMCAWIAQPSTQAFANPLKIQSVRLTQLLHITRLANSGKKKSFTKERKKNFKTVILHSFLCIVSCDSLSHVAANLCSFSGLKNFSASYQIVFCFIFRVLSVLFRQRSDRPRPLKTYL